MIKLKSIINESKESKKDDKPVDLVDITDAVSKFFNSNKASLKKLAADDKWKEFYQKGYDKFPDAEQSEVAQAMNKAASMAEYFKNEEVAEMPTEKELEEDAFGPKKDVGKGIKMADYVKKNKPAKSEKFDSHVQTQK